MKIEKTSYTIDKSVNDSALPKGLNLVLLADFHDGDCEAVLNIVRDDVPDVILIPGDVELEILKSTGINLLDNEWTELSVYDKCSEEPGERILIGGLTSAHVISYRRFREQCNKESNTYERYPYRPRPRDIGRYPADSEWLEDFARQEGYKILLCHHPEYWALREPMIRDKTIDLVLSGHAHGGQWQILGHGIFAPGQGLLPKYTHGVHYGPYGRLIISRGLSNPYSFAPRWGNPPEVVYLRF